MVQSNLDALAEGTPVRGVTFQEAGSACWNSTQNGFKVGELFADKANNIIYRLVDMDELVATFEDMSLKAIGDTTVTKISVKHADLKNAFRLFRGKMQHRLPEEHVLPFLPSTHVVLTNDEGRVDVFLKLRQLAQQYASHEFKVEYLMGPNEIRAREVVKKQRIEIVALHRLG